MSVVYRENKKELNDQLFEAAEDGDVKECRRFIENGADIDERTSSASENATRLVEMIATKI